MPFVKISIVTVFLIGMTFAKKKSNIDTRVPKEVSQYINKMLEGSKGCDFANFENYKVGMGFDSLTKLSDVTAGDPIKIFWLKTKPLKEKPSNEPHIIPGPRIPLVFTQSEINGPVSKMISNNGRGEEWFIPLLEKNKIVNFERIRYDDWRKEWQCSGELQVLRMTIANLWQIVIKQWPKSKGYNPILIQIGSNSWLLHVPEKDDYNLTFLLYHHDASPDSLNLMIDPSYSTLTKSKDLLKYLMSPNVFDRLR